MSCCGAARKPFVAERAAPRRAQAQAATPTTDGQVMASKQKAAERLAVCQACPHARFRPVMHCVKCGCVLALKTKLKAGACPVGKW